MNYLNAIKITLGFAIDFLLIYVLSNEANDIYKKKVANQTAPTPDDSVNKKNE